MLKFSKCLILNDKLNQIFLVIKFALRSKKFGSAQDFDDYLEFYFFYF